MPFHLVTFRALAEAPGTSRKAAPSPWAAADPGGTRTSEKGLLRDGLCKLCLKLAMHRGVQLIGWRIWAGWKKAAG